MAKDKVGRNDPCPCGSGKKYKKCCLEKMDVRSPTATQTFPEELVIGKLLNSSKEFAAFYHAERRKIVKPVQWTQDPSLPEGVDHQATQLLTGEQVISLRRVPARLEDAISIAHELQHFLLSGEGFPSTGCEDKRLYDVSSSLNSMLHDPLVNSRLQAYGFDLWNQYETEVSRDSRTLEAEPSPPSGSLRRMLWIFNYVANTLDWELAYNKAGKSDNEFQSWFDARYPDVAEEGQELLASVRSIGFDTPENMGILLNEIIRKYKLKGLYIVGVR